MGDITPFYNYVVGVHHLCTKHFNTSRANNMFHAGKTTQLNSSESASHPNKNWGQIRSLWPFGAPPSKEATKRVPTQTASAPKARDIARCRPSEMPPAAMTGTCLPGWSLRSLRHTWWIKWKIVAENWLTWIWLMFYGKCIGPVNIPYQSHGFILWVMAFSWHWNRLKDANLLRFKLGDNPMSRMPVATRIIWYYFHF